MLLRHIEHTLRTALTDRPVVLLQGARQVGKTTLVRAFAEGRAGERPARYVTLDDLTTLAAVRADPVGFLTGAPARLIIDEVQRVPELLIAIKAAVDRDRAPGRFLLTGSANVLLLPRIAESLAGRMELVTLWPLSQGEFTGTVDGFVDAAFGDAPPDHRASAVWPGIVERVLRGGFPEPAAMPKAERRHAWFEAYLTTILQRDVRDLARIDGLVDLPRLLSLIASRPMGLTNFAELARSAGLPQTTLKRYVALLETVFLVRSLPAWHANLGKRLVRSPKMFVADSGLGAHLMGLDADRIARDRSLFGGLLESFVAMELQKQIGWSRTRPTLHHLRTHTGEEVDFVLERRDGTLVGIEVKSASVAGTADFRGLRALSAAVGDRLHRGIVLYTGAETVPFGERLHAMPVDALWQWGAGAIVTG